MPALDPTIKQRLLQHLDTCVAELDLDFGLSSSAESNKETVKAEADSEARPDSSTAGGDENNNGNTVVCTLRYWMVKITHEYRIFRTCSCLGGYEFPAIMNLSAT